MKKTIFIYLILIIFLIIFHLFYYSLLIKYIIPLLSLIYLIYNYLNYKNIMTFKNKYYLPLIILISLLFLNFYLAVGLFYGYTLNPLKNLLTNIIDSIIPLISIELLRHNLIKNKKNKPFIITLLIIFLELNYHTLFTLNLKRDLYTYFCSEVIPLILSNFLFTYLTIHFHYTYSIILNILDKLIIYFVPFLPKTNWYLIGTSSLIKISLCFIIFQYIFNKKHKVNIFPSFLTIIMVILLTLFTLGMFKYEAIVILSNSMYPTLEKGDIVIYEKDIQNVHEKDIIVFETKDKTIVHRVVKKINNSYLTKGDNNNVVDNYKVDKKDIKGIYKFSLKYLGLPAVYLEEFLNKGGT